MNDDDVNLVLGRHVYGNIFDPSTNVVAGNENFLLTSADVYKAVSSDVVLTPGGNGVVKIASRVYIDGELLTGQDIREFKQFFRKRRIRLARKYLLEAFRGIHDIVNTITSFLDISS